MKAVLQTILFTVATLALSPAAIAQEHCNGICQMARAYDDLFSRYEGWGGAKLRPAVARSECGEIFGAEPTGRTCSGCKNHEQHDCAPFRMIETKVSGVDSRIDSRGNPLPGARLTREEELKANKNTGLIACSSTNDNGTVTLVRKDNGYIFMGAAHLIIPSDADKNLPEQELAKNFKRYANSCQVIMVDGAGKEIVRFDVDPDRIKPGSYKPSANLAGDWVVFAVKPQENGGSPRDLDYMKDAEVTKVVPAGDLSQEVEGKMIAYHHDIIPEGTKIKTYGSVKVLEEGSLLARKFPGYVGHDIDTYGWASGALIRNSKGEAFAIHVGGYIPPGKSADWRNYANLAIPFDSRILHSINSL